MIGWRGVAGGVLVVAAWGLQGCASIVSGSTQVVSVDTPGCAGARCELSNDKGRYFVASTPGTVSLARSYNNLQVVCTRGEASSTPLSVASTTKGMAFGNILFGGVIGAGVDISTGAAYDYPQLISVAMQCAAPGTAVVPLRLGVEVEAAGAPPVPGVKVLRVEGGSLAEQWGLKPGDVILRINGNVMQDPAGLASLVAAFAADRRQARELELLLRRPDAADEQLRRVTVPAAGTP